MEKLLNLSYLNKSYGQQVVLSDISFKLEAGNIIGLIGPSGAGKSTMIKTMLGMEKADSGTALVLNKKMPNRMILGEIGYMAQSDALYESLTGLENLRFFGQMKKLSGKELEAAILHVSSVVDLSDSLDKYVHLYSGGMKRRLSLAIALLGNPKLLILDEPTVGIDPSLRKKIWEELAKLRDNGIGILVTTHVMDEAELTDRVGLLLGGHIIALDSPENLKNEYGVNSIEEVFLKAEGE
ncbi:MAG: ABC transporter ATP-binding protein [Streptococcus sp.]|nr:ABC transporter ATP-binding protein [Streptococcus sp.]